MSHDTGPWALLTAAVALLLAIAGPVRAQEPELTYELVLPGTPAEHYAMWISEEEARTFLAHEVRIEPRVGGRYETLFDPVEDPAGALAGTYGSKIVALDPPRRLVFQWHALTPRKAAEELGGVRRRQQSLLVEVGFEHASLEPATTRIRVRHEGFGEGPDWDAQYRYYRDHGWPWIFRRLAERFGKEPTTMVVSAPAPGR